MTSANKQNNYNSFLESAISSEGQIIPTKGVLDWIKEQNKKVAVNIQRTSFSKLKGWYADDRRIFHETGKFFSIDGIRVITNWSKIKQWDQPIINQPEVGYLGFIVKEINGVLHFLLQAKIEPGNVNYVQLSPTLQATRSNYSQVHRGKVPLYLDYFKNASEAQILLDQLQSEQGARFLKKRNRNIIIKVEDEIPLFDNFIWVTLGQIKNLMQNDNIVNMDTRTVISGIQFGNNHLELSSYCKSLSKHKAALLKSAITCDEAYNSIDRIITFLTKLKSENDLEVEKIPLNNLNEWTYIDKEIAHNEGKYFKVIAVDVEIGNREIVKWSQPMIEPAQEGLCVFVCKEIDGILHFAVQAKLECGNLDIVELAPTVQCLTGNYRQTKEGALPFLDYVLNVEKDQIVYDTLQSEEGGRFYREQNRNMIVISGNEIPDELPEKYIWMTLNQLYTFLKFNNYLNIQARSLIASISFV
ncbi:MAG: NDP-hexose 2,3-dehydratase family protein [Bacteroidales bacterium]